MKRKSVLLNEPKGKQSQDTRKISCRGEKIRAGFIPYFFKMLIGSQFSSSLPKTIKKIMKRKPPKKSLHLKESYDYAIVFTLQAMHLTPQQMRHKQRS